MDSELKEYLLHEWKFNNHTKYLKYFEDWIVNVTENQIVFYSAYRIGDKTPFITYDSR